MGNQLNGSINNMVIKRVLVYCECNSGNIATYRCDLGDKNVSSLHPYRVYGGSKCIACEQCIRDNGHYFTIHTQGWKESDKTITPYEPVKIEEKTKLS